MKQTLKIHDWETRPGRLSFWGGGFGSAYFQGAFAVSFREGTKVKKPPALCQLKLCGWLSKALVKARTEAETCVFSTFVQHQEARYDS